MSAAVQGLNVGFDITRLTTRQCGIENILFLLIKGKMTLSLQINGTTFRTIAPWLKSLRPAQWQCAASLRQRFGFNPDLSCCLCGVRTFSLWVSWVSSCYSGPSCIPDMQAIVCMAMVSQEGFVVVCPR